MRTQVTGITGSFGVCILAHRNIGGMKGTLLHLSGMILQDFSQSWASHCSYYGFLIKVGRPDGKSSPCTYVNFYISILICIFIRLKTLIGQVQPTVLIARLSCPAVEMSPHVSALVVLNFLEHTSDIQRIEGKFTGAFSKAEAKQRALKVYGSVQSILIFNEVSIV